jgi:2-keto-4-pentenoate hydratase/2-oxohepta-3-ene-1,7-dioic acid hydratase in catechol pathway
MKLVAFATSSSAVRPGALLDAETVLDLAHAACALPAREHQNDTFDLAHPFLRAARKLVASAAEPDERQRLQGAGAVLAQKDVVLHAPVPRPGKILCIGLNYKDHAEEQGAKLPERPLVFSKFATCVLAPGGTIVIPPGSKQTDYEAELAVVIGLRTRRVSREDAMQHVLGYTNFHDVSARDFQFADGQWQRGKACDTFAPFGEFIATTDQIPDPHHLGIRLRLNGKTMQDSNTNQLVFRVPELIEFLSAHFTLEPGDVIATGTPPGVGFARKPPVYMQPGDTVEVEIDGLGVLTNRVAAADV